MKILIDQHQNLIKTNQFRINSTSNQPFFTFFQNLGMPSVMSGIETNFEAPNVPYQREEQGNYHISKSENSDEK